MFLTECLGLDSLPLNVPSKASSVVFLRDFCCEPLAELLGRLLNDDSTMNFPFTLFRIFI